MLAGPVDFPRISVSKSMYDTVELTILCALNAIIVVLLVLRWFYLMHHTKNSDVQIDDVAMGTLGCFLNLRFLITQLKQ